MLLKCPHGTTPPAHLLGVWLAYSKDDPEHIIGRGATPREARSMAQAQLCSKPNGGDDDAGIWVIIFARPVWSLVELLAQQRYQNRQTKTPGP